VGIELDVFFLSIDIDAVVGVPDDVNRFLGGDWCGHDTSRADAELLKARDDYTAVFENDLAALKLEQSFRGNVDGRSREFDAGE